MVSTDVKRLFVLLCGFEILPKTVSTRDRGGRFIMAEPVCSYLLDTRRGWVLLDAGTNPAHIDDPQRRAELFEWNGMAPPVIRPEHRIEAQLALIGIGLEDIAWVICSHLHYDHCGYLPRLAHAPVSVQRRELEYARRHPSHGYIAEDFASPALQWDLRDGDWDAMDGLKLLDTRGHTDGHQSALVTLPSGQRYLLPFDAGDLAENFAEEVLPGGSVDDAAALAAIRRLKAIQREEDAVMLLFHDPVAIQQMRLAPEFYD